MCSVSSLYGDQAITGLLKSCKGWEEVLWEIQNLKIQNGSHSNIPLPSWPSIFVGCSNDRLLLF